MYFSTGIINKLEAFGMRIHLFFYQIDTNLLHPNSIKLPLISVKSNIILYEEMHEFCISHVGVPQLILYEAQRFHPEQFEYFSKQRQMGLHVTQKNAFNVEIIQNTTSQVM